MSNVIKIKRGLESKLPSSLQDGELALTTDSYKLYAGTGGGLTQINKNTTYKLSKSGSTITLTGSDGSTTSVADSNTTYSAATTSANGLMSSADKSKLDGIASGANAYTHPSYTARTGKPTANQTPAFGGTATISQITSDATGHVTAATDRTITIPSTLSNGTGTAGLIKTTSTITSNSGYTACPVISGVPYYKDTNTTYSAATTSANGLMSSSDKTKLNGIAAGAQVNNVVVSTTEPTASTAEVWINPNGQLDLSALWNSIYPVGAIYMSVSSTNPGTLFPGTTWAALQDRFLVGAGNSYSNGATGGAATVSLTTAQLPSHTHTIPALSGSAASAGAHTHSVGGDHDAGSGSYGWSVHDASSGAQSYVGYTSSAGSHTHTVTTNASTSGSTGSGSAHNNLPPYLAVYMWKRTA